MEEVIEPVKCRLCNMVMDPDAGAAEIYKHKDADGKVLFVAHDRCAMRQEIQQKTTLINNLTAITLGLLQRYCGGTARVTKEDVDAGIQAGGGNISVKQEQRPDGTPGDFLVSCGKPDARLIVPATSMPKLIS